MSRHTPASTLPSSFRRSLLAASIVVSLSACVPSVEDPNATDGETVAGALPDISFALPGLNYSRFEKTETGLAFESDSTPDFTAVADDQTEHVEINWAAEDDSTQYQVYRRENDAQMLNDQLCNDFVIDDQSEFDEIAVITDNFYVDVDISNSIRYEYLILATNSLGKTKTIASGLIVSIGEAKAIIALQSPGTDIPEVPAAANPDDVDTSVPEVPATPEPANPVDPDPVTPPVDSGTTDPVDEVVDEVEEAGSPFDPVPEAPAEPETPDVPEVSTPDPVEPEAPVIDKPAQPVPSEPTPETDLPVVGCGQGETPDNDGVDDSDTTDPDTGPVVELSLPEITSPTPDSVLSGSSVMLNWSANETAVIQWWIRAGSSAGGKDYYDSDRITNASTRTHMMTGLPTDGRPIHVQLTYKKPTGGWEVSQYVYTAATVEEKEVIVEQEQPNLGAANGGDSDWDNKVMPPELVNPIEIVLSADYPTVHVDDFDRVGCEGLIHRLNLPYDQDVLVTMAPGSAALKYPVFIYGGKNLILRGMEMRPVVQAGCDIGEAHQMRDTANKNIHPRLPGGKLFRLEQSGTTFVEGVDIDLKGLEADCFVLRNPSSMSISQALTDRHMIFVNTRCTGIEGLDDSPVGDGIHGDFFQNQGKDSFGSFIIENVSFRTSSNGITLHAWNGQANTPRLFSLRNMDYGWDLRYDDDDKYEISGLAYSAHGKTVKFENVYLNHPKNGNYGFINGERVGAIDRNNGYIKKVDGVYEGTPPGGDYAREDETGIEYVSPY